MNPVVYARIAGLAYLAIFILAIGANFTVLEGLRVPGDPAATLSNLRAGGTAFRFAIAALFAVLFADLIVAWALHVLFQPLAPRLTGLTMLFRVAYTLSHIPFVVLLVIALRAALAGASAIERAVIGAAHGAAHPLASAAFTAGRMRRLTGASPLDFRINRPAPFASRSSAVISSMFTMQERWTRRNVAGRRVSRPASVPVCSMRRPSLKRTST